MDARGGRSPVTGKYQSIELASDIHEVLLPAGVTRRATEEEEPEIEWP